MQGSIPCFHKLSEKTPAFPGIITILFAYLFTADCYSTAT